MKALYIPEDKINEIKNRVNIVDIIGEFVQLKPSGKNYKGLCPFHSEKTPSFTVSPARGIFHCFGCGVGGNVFNFLMKFKGIGFPEAVKLLADRVGISVQTKTGVSDKRHYEVDALYKILQETAVLYQKNLLSSAGTNARKYLKERSITARMVQEFHIGYASDSWDSVLVAMQGHGFTSVQIEEAGLAVKNKRGTGFYDRFRNRIMFPIQDSIGRYIGFGGRILNNEQQDVPKYINTNENRLFHKGAHLYGFFQAENSIRKEGCVFITEGYIDVIRMHEQGFINTLAPLGTALTDQHISLILRHTGTVYLLFDPDRAGMNAALKSTSLLHTRSIDPYIIRLPSGFDPGDFFDTYSAADFKLLLEDRISGLDYIVNSFIDSKKRYTANEKIVILQALSEHYTGMTDEILKEDFSHKVAAALKTDTDLIKRKFSQFSRKKVAHIDTQPSTHKRISTVDTELHLLLLILNNPELFPIAGTRLDESYFYGKWTKKLWNAISGMRDVKGWNAASVFTIIENDTFKDYLSGRLLEESLNYNPKEQLIDLVAKLKEIRLKKHLADINQRLKTAELEDDEKCIAELIAEKNTFRNELDKLRSLRLNKDRL